MLDGGLSIIIPTLDSAEDLVSTLPCLAGAGEIVVSDGGSRDRTADMAPAYGAICLVGPRGRGAQLAAGIAAARGAWLLLLHADTRLDRHWPEAAAAHAGAHPRSAGYFRFALDSTDPRARRLERQVAWRCRRLALPYGDQGLLIRRDLLDSVGGLRPLPLMEDVDLVRRLGRSRLRPLAASATTSARRWERDGWNRRSARNLLCLGLFFAGLPPARIARIYG